MTEPTGLPSEARLLAALRATWPPAAEEAAEGWMLRDGAGGGSRVSAAVSAGGRDPAALAALARARGRTPLAQTPDGDPALDAAFAEAGWEAFDPTALYAAPAVSLAMLPLPEGVVWVEGQGRVVLLEEIWETDGVDAARRAVMARAPGPSATIMTRTDHAVAGVGFAALDGEVAMLHAAVVRPEQRRQGAGRALVAGAADWAVRNGADVLALAVTEANAPARTLYEACGMRRVGGYRYRRLAR